MNKEIINIWNFLQKNNVKYLTIGGLAVNLYGYGRNTGDIDIYIADTIENRHNLGIALENLGISNIENIETMQFIPGWTDFTLNYNFRLDVMTSVLGLEKIPFNELLLKANVVDIDNVLIYFIDYDSLILTKQASNRPKDILDIEELEKINRKE